MAMHGLPLGGAEKFFIRLARALNANHDLTCYIPCLRGGDAALAGQLRDLRVISVPGFGRCGYHIFYKLTLMLRQMFPECDLEAALHNKMLARLHRKHSFDIVNPHLMEATRQTCQAFRNIRLPIAESDHGHYATVDTKNLGRSEIVFQRLNALICPAQANVDRAGRFPWREGFRTFTVPYGYEPPSGIQPKIKEEAFTYGLVARGVEQKGWNEALAAARIVRARIDRPIKLIFVGEGPCLDALRRETTESWVTFAGRQDEPENYIQQFDVGLLPTCLKEESLPNSIIEYLACGKPVIATAIGGIPEMIGGAGMLIPLGADGRADVPALAEAMLQLATHPARRQALAAQTGAAFARFRMETCVNAYEAAFASLLTA